MCRTITPTEKQVLCGRCGNVANPNDGWEHGWPLFGTIDIGFPAQAFGALCGMEHCADQHHFDWWHEGHPALIENGAQRVTFKWNDSDKWRLCYECQKQLLRVIGEFFGIPARAEQLRQKCEITA